MYTAKPAQRKGENCYVEKKEVVTTGYFREYSVEEIELHRELDFNDMPAAVQPALVDKYTPVKLVDKAHMYVCVSYIVCTCSLC